MIEIKKFFVRLKDNQLNLMFYDANTLKSVLRIMNLLLQKEVKAINPTSFEAFLKLDFFPEQFQAGVRI
jgi:hypothetical protein